MRLLNWPIPVSVHIEWPRFLKRFFERSPLTVVVETVRIRHLVDSEVGEADSLIAVLEFHDQRCKPTDLDHVDLRELYRSLANDGTFFIWTCSCGAPGCAGFFKGVVVSHEQETTWWHDLDGNRKFQFQSSNLLAAYRQGIIEGREQLSRCPELEVTPEQNAVVYRDDE